MARRLPAGMLGGAAFALYPNVLPASTDPGAEPAVYNTLAAPYCLRVGLVWWCIGAVRVLGYFVFLCRHAYGKAVAGRAGDGN